MNEASLPAISVVITTHNRVDDLRIALNSCRDQKDVAFEVLVYDDASTDGTSEMVKAEFPEVRVFRNDQRGGYIGLRNRGFCDALSGFVVSIDDDAYFTGADTLARVVEMFHQDEKTAAIALPYVEPKRVRDKPPRPPESGALIRNYIGCAHAVRVDIAKQMGPYPECLVHQGEERDLCIRLLDAGHNIVYADTSPIVHTVSENRNKTRINYYGYRNTIVFAWMRIPWPYVVGRMFKDSIALMMHRFRFSNLMQRIVALSAGFWFALTHPHYRQSVGVPTYKRYRSLPIHGPCESSQTEPNA